MATLKGPVTRKMLVLMKAQVLLLLSMNGPDRNLWRSMDRDHHDKWMLNAGRKRTKAFPMLDPDRQGLIKIQEALPAKKDL